MLNMINKINLHSLMTEVLIMEPNVYRNSPKYYSRVSNGVFSHRTPFIIFSIISAANHYTIATKERKSMDDDWSPIYKIRIPKSDY